DHLQLTIDYYLTYSTLPKLEQVKEFRIKQQNQIQQEQRRRRTIEKRLMIPGIDIVGCGYDIFTLQSKTCLFDLTVNDNSIWIDAFNNFTTYKVPDNFFVLNTRDTTSTYKTSFYDRFQEFWQNSIYVMTNDWDLFFGFAASHTRTEIIQKYHQFFKYHSHMAWTRQQITSYTLAISDFPTPNLSELTRLAINNLPFTFNSRSVRNLAKWKSFFNSYGTHYVTRSEMGGLMSSETYFESCLLIRYNETWIKTQSEKRFLWFFKVTDNSESYTSYIDKIFQQYTRPRFTLIGGLQQQSDLGGPHFKLDQWLYTIKDYPQPVSYHLQPVYTLLADDDPRYDALKEATFYCRSLAVNETNIFIQQLQTADKSASCQNLPENY
ncbi:unnamed protein product, partial [Didymodactylos carnosus]